MLVGDRDLEVAGVRPERQRADRVGEHLGTRCDRCTDDGDATFVDHGASEQRRAGVRRPKTLAPQPIDVRMRACEILAEEQSCVRIALVEAVDDAVVVQRHRNGAPLRDQRSHCRHVTGGVALKPQTLDQPDRMELGAWTTRGYFVERGLGDRERLVPVTLLCGVARTRGIDAFHRDVRFLQCRDPTRPDGRAFGFVEKLRKDRVGAQPIIATRVGGGNRLERRRLTARHVGRDLIDGKQGERTRARIEPRFRGERRSTRFVGDRVARMRTRVERQRGDGVDVRSHGQTRRRGDRAHRWCDEQAGELVGEFPRDVGRRADDRIGASK